MMALRVRGQTAVVVDSKQRVSGADNEVTGAERARVRVRRESLRESVTAGGRGRG